MFLLNSVVEWCFRVDLLLLLMGYVSGCCCWCKKVGGFFVVTLVMRWVTLVMRWVTLVTLVV